MRLIKNKIEHNGSGTVTLLPEEPEDLVCPITVLREHHADAPQFSGTHTT